MGEFDVVELLTLLSARCVELLGATAAGILLVDPNANLRVIASSSEEAELLELFQVQNQQGPSIECFRTGGFVAVPDLGSTSAWPLFAAECLAAGYPSVCAVPLSLRGQTIGCLNMFMSEPRALPDADVVRARALADVATIAIVQDAATREATAREVQLRHALESRVVIEQAKGMIAEHAHIDFDHAFSLLRSYARSQNKGITTVARLITTGRVSTAAVSRTTRYRTGLPEDSSSSS